MNKNNFSLGIIIPALNEEGSLICLVENLLKVIYENNINSSILIINDGSTDKTAEHAIMLETKFKNVTAIHNKKTQNIGYCYQLGISNLDTDFITWLPADGEISPEIINDIYPLLNEDEVIITYPVTNKYKRPILRRLLSKIYQQFFNTFLPINLKYYNGNSVFPRKALTNYKILSRGFTINAELIIHAVSTLNYRYIEIPFTLHRRSSGKSKAISLRQLFDVIFHVYLIIKGKQHNSKKV